MRVIEDMQMRVRGVPLGLSVVGTALLAASCGGAGAQEQALPSAPSAVARPLVLTGGVTVEREQPGVVRLTLDDAIATALKQNTELRVRIDQEKYVHGQVLTVGNALAPNISVNAYSQAQEVDLAALGFKPSSLSGLKFNGQTVGTIAPIVKINTTSAELQLSQALFNVPAFYLYRAARKAVDATVWETLNSRGGVVITVGGLYLRVLADAAQVRNAEGLVKQDELVYEHAKASKEAGVGINLDVLRAQVDLQNEQQALVQARNSEAKDKIQLNREMNQPAGQELELVDTVPFAEFNELSLGDAMKLAEVRRKDLRGLESQLEVAEQTQKAVKYERVPTLGFGGYYGLIGETTGSYHGNFVAEGQLSVPVFEEGELRGQKEVAVAQTRALRQQIESRRGSIEGEIRSAMLDVQSAAELVKVARSNVDLASEALSDATMRFTAGVDDNLPVERAQAALVGAQTQVIQAEFQYNYAKLTLARNTGVVETQYRDYLGR
jgi:outer membrane protein TolC